MPFRDAKPHPSLTKCLASIRPQYSSNAPGCHRDGEPCQRCGDEGPEYVARDQQRKHDSKRHHSERAEDRAGGVERGGLLAASPAVETGLSFAADFVLLDKCRTRTENSGES